MWTRQKSVLGDSTRRKSSRRKKSENFIFRTADGTVKLSGREQVLRKSTLIRDQPERGEECKDDLRRESDGSHPLDTMTDDCNVCNDFGRWKRITFLVITLNQEVNFVCPKKNHSQHHCDFSTRSGVSVLLRSRKNDYWNVDCDRNLSELWTGFTQFILFNETPPERIHVIPLMT